MLFLWFSYVFQDFQINKNSLPRPGVLTWEAPEDVTEARVRWMEFVSHEINSSDLVCGLEHDFYFSIFSIYWE